MHLRIEIGRFRLQLWREPKHDVPETEPQPMIYDHPTPAVIYHPERVGFYRMSDEAD